MAKFGLLLLTLLISAATIYSKSIEDDLASVIQAKDNTIERNGEDNKRGFLQDEDNSDDNLKDDDQFSDFGDLEVKRGLDDSDNVEEMDGQVIEVLDEARQRRATNSYKCPSGYKRYDIDARHRRKFKLEIQPNYNNQIAAWGLYGADDVDSLVHSHLKMKDDDFFTVVPKAKIRPCLCGQICFSTFVVDRVKITVFNKQKKVAEYSYVPQQTDSWFRPVCTPVVKFAEITKIVFKYEHQPPNFNMKDLHVVACIPK